MGKNGEKVARNSLFFAQKQRAKSWLFCVCICNIANDSLWTLKDEDNNSNNNITNHHHQQHYLVVAVTATKTML